MRLSVVMIARNERENVRPCFESFWDHADEVVLCDTGSRDDTIGEARRFARERGEPGKLTVGRFKWCDDFAAARNHAHSLATGEIHFTVDLDDRLMRGTELRDLVAEFAKKPKLKAITLPLEGPFGGIWRLRLLRAPVHWEGPVWERPITTGFDAWDAESEQRTGRTDDPRSLRTSRITLWHTRKVSHGRRDLEIAQKWAAREPRDWWPWYVCAVEAGHIEDWEALDIAVDRLLAITTPPRIMGRALATQAQSYIEQGAVRPRPCARRG